MILVAIYDRKADNVENVYVQPNETMAYRAFEQACKDPSSMLSKYPDFELIKLADLDDMVVKPCHSLLVKNSVFIDQKGEGDE